METRYTVGDIADDVIDFTVYDNVDEVTITVPFNYETMPEDETVISLTRQGLANIIAKLNLPEPEEDDD